MYDSPVVYDTFTDVNGTLLINHTPDVDVVGEGWKQKFFFGVKDIGILNNGATPINPASTTTTLCYINGGVTVYRYTGKVKMASSSNTFIVRSDNNIEYYIQVTIFRAANLMRLYSVHPVNGAVILQSAPIVVSQGVFYEFEFIVTEDTVSFTANGYNIFVETELYNNNTYCGFLCYGSLSNSHVYDDIKIEPEAHMPVYVTPENIYVVKYENRVLEPSKTLDFVVPSEQRTLYVR